MISLKLMREFEAGREVADDLGDRHTTPTGDAYVTVGGLGGADDARAAFAEYAKDKKGRLYWRALPELNHDKDGAAFFMRVFIARS